MPSLSALEKKKARVYDELGNAKKEFRENHSLNKGIGYAYHNANRFFSTIIGATQKYVFEHKLKELKSLLPKLFKIQTELMNAIDKYRSKLINRQQIVERLSLPLPNYLIEKTGTKIANTDRYARDIYIRDQAQRFRRQVFDYIRSKDGFGYKFFTQMEPENMKNDMRDYPEKYFNLSYYRNNYPTLNLQDRPKFSFKKPFQFPMEIFFLLIMNLILVVLGSHLFMRSKLL